MELLRPDEIELRGFWLDLGSRMVPDSVWERINRLTADHLQSIATREEKPGRLFRDPSDGRYWELAPVEPTLPQGPPRLTAISPDEARERWGVS